MDPHGSSWLLKRKRTLLSPSSPSGLELRGMRGKVGKNTTAAKTPRVRRAGHTEDVT